MTELSKADLDLRLRLARAIAARGHAPPLAELAGESLTSVAEMEESLRRLHRAHALLLHPGRCEPWVVHPFALSPGGALWRFASDWYGNCLDEPWRKRSPAEVRALFEAHELTGAFWSW